MRILIDTNILLRTVEPAHPQHAQATLATDLLRRQGNTLRRVPQNIYEFWVVATRPTDVNGLGMTSTESETNVSDLLGLFSLLRDERAVFERWLELVVRYDVHGVNAHDARLAAAMKRYGIDAILTFNVSDFRRFDDLNVLAPSEVIAGNTNTENASES